MYLFESGLPRSPSPTEGECTCRTSTQFSVQLHQQSTSVLRTLCLPQVLGATPVSLLEMKNHGPHPYILILNQILCFRNILREVICTLKFEKHLVLHLYFAGEKMKGLRGKLIYSRLCTKKGDCRS